MAVKKNKLLTQLEKTALDFSFPVGRGIFVLLEETSKHNWKAGAELLRYAELLLFMAAHPRDEKMRSAIEHCMQRLSQYIKKQKWQNKEAVQNTGLPALPIVTVFSHDLLSWLLEKNAATVTVDSFSEGSKELAEVLAVSLGPFERELLNYGYDEDGLLEALQVKRKNLLPFILSELSQFDDRPFLKDKLFESMGMYVRVQDNSGKCSRFSNRFMQRPVFYHSELLKKFDHLTLMNTAVPVPAGLDQKQKEALCAVIRMSLVLTARETDPSTYMDLHSLRLYHLERGISIALYGMLPERQLPVESYIGYTLLKNGFPCAYGGAWVFGRRALFGMNIFEPYRGGESGYMMCQLLRLYRQVFNVSVFEVEPYQFGKDNPDGIKSGAFWFYYKYGFRPDDKVLRKLAEKEKQKISSQPGYFSSTATLKKFTESFLSLEFEPVTQPRLAELAEKVTAYIARHHAGNRPAASIQSGKWLAESSAALQGRQGVVFSEWALLSAALREEVPLDPALIELLISTREQDLYAYQQHLIRWLSLLKDSNH